KATGAARRVFELIDRVPKITVADEPVGRPVEGRVAFDDVRFAYPTRRESPALREVSLTIAPGEKLALVGPSGSGKSTIANLLMRFYDPDSGTVRIDETDLRHWDPDALRQYTGVVAQEPVLFSGTVRENVLYGDLTAPDRTATRPGRPSSTHWRRPTPGSSSRSFPRGSTPSSANGACA
ncbi:MAG: ATP-binding cassette domain-containing protein, partial [Bradymonadaceae bacterium]